MYLDQAQFEAMQTQIKTIAESLKSVETNTTPEKVETFESLIEGVDIFQGLNKNTAVFNVDPGESFEQLVERMGYDGPQAA